MATPPLLDFGGPGGLAQRVWRVPPGEATDALAAELTASDHYIADGHHRVAASVAAWQRYGEPEGSSVLCVIHPMDGLRLSAFHRRVLGPVDRAELVAVLEPGFTVEPVAAAPDPEPGSYGLYAEGRWHLVTAQRRRTAGSTSRC